MTIDPTVGRIVLFSPAHDDSELRREYAPFAAIIASIGDRDMVNLTVFGRHGSTHARGYVPLAQGTMVDDPEGAYCMWMEYQRGQAARVDQTAALISRIEAFESVCVRCVEKLREMSAALETTVRPEQPA